MNAKMLTALGLVLPICIALQSGVARAECSPTDQTTAQQAYSTAYEFARAGAWKDVIAALEPGLAACPEHWDSVELLAQARMRSGDYTGSAKAYASLIRGKYKGDMSAAEDRILRGYGYVAIRSKDLATGRQIYEAILAQDPMNVDAHKMLAYAYEKAGNYADAIKHMRELYDLEPAKSGEHAKKLGELYRASGDAESASEWLSRASNQGVASTASFKMGVDYIRSKDWAKAAEQFRIYLKANPKSARAWKNLGTCYEKMKKLTDAVDAYEKALEIDPGKHDVAGNLGFVYLDLGQLAKADRIASEAIQNWPKKDPKLPGMYYLKGKVLEKRGEYEEAIARFRLAADDPYWGEFASKEIERQKKLIEIRELKRKQQGR